MKARRWIKACVVLAVLLAGGYLANSIYTKQQRAEALQQYLGTLPDFQFTALDGKLIGSEDMPARDAVALLFFSPDCAYCQAQAAGLSEQVISSANVQFLWISDDSPALVRAFADRYALDRPPNSRVVTAAYDQIKASFGIRQWPSTLIYDRQRRLAGQFSGETKWEAILVVINEQAAVQQ